MFYNLLVPYEIISSNYSILFVVLMILRRLKYDRFNFVVEKRNYEKFLIFDELPFIMAI